MALDETVTDDFTFDDPLEESGSEDSMSGKSAPRIRTTDAILMLGTAIFYDCIETVFSLILHAIPVAGTLLEAGMAFIFSGLFSLTFYIWFKIKDVRFMTWRRIVPQLAALVIELIPILDLLPSRVLSILIIIFLTRLEDKKHLRINP